MLRFSKQALRKGTHTPVYDKSTVKTLTEAALNSPFKLSETIPGLKKGHPLLNQIAKSHPNLESAPDPQPTTLDRLYQRSYEEMRGRLTSENTGWKKEYKKLKAEKSYQLPIDSTKWNWYDEKITTEEEKVAFYEHADFVSRHLKELSDLGQIYFFFEAIGLGLSKNPFMTLEEKLDEIARYVQYFIFKKDIVLGTDLLSAEKFETLENCKFASRIISEDHWSKPGYNPRHTNRDQKWSLTEDRPEHFYLVLESEADFRKMKAVFGDDLKKATAPGRPGIKELDNPSFTKSSGASEAHGIRCKLSSFSKTKGKFEKFDFESVNYKQEEYSFRTHGVRSNFDQDLSKTDFSKPLDQDKVKEIKRDFLRFQQSVFSNKHGRRRKAKAGTLVT